MRLLKFVSWSATAGLAAPLVFHLLWLWPVSQSWYISHNWLVQLRLMLWPSSIGFLAANPSNELTILGVMTAANIALYALLGAILWIGIRQKYVLALLALLIVGLWILILFF